MGGSESRFLFYSEQDCENCWHAPLDFQTSSPLCHRPMDPNDRYAKILLKCDGNYINMRFDNHPQPFIAGVGEQVVYMGHSYDDTCKWYLLLIACRRSAVWAPVPPGQKLDWDNASGKEFLCVIVNVSSKLVISYDNGRLILVTPPAADDAASVRNALFVMKTVDHNWSQNEMLTAFGGGALGGVVAATLPIFGPAVVAAAATATIGETVGAAVGVTTAGVGAAKSSSYVASMVQGTAPHFSSRTLTSAEADIYKPATLLAIGQTLRDHIFHIP